MQLRNGDERVAKARRVTPLQIWSEHPARQRGKAEECEQRYDVRTRGQHALDPEGNTSLRMKNRSREPPRCRSFVVRTSGAPKGSAFS